MNKKEVMELKRRFKKDACTFTRICGCYVDGDKNIVTSFGETFLNLEDEEFYKYLEIANKSLSGTVGNNLLTLEFPLSEEEAGGKQQFLMGLLDSKLKNEALLERFYEIIIENYEIAGNYLILLFHDAYDVITKTSDNRKLDESEEVFEYLICAICPVTLSKPGLGYHEEENRFGPRVRDWVVGVPDSGFLFPAFHDRSTDIHSVLFYTKDTKEPHTELMEGGLSCPSRRTATEQKNTFHSIIKSTCSADSEEGEALLMELQEGLYSMVEEHEAVKEKDEEPMVLTKDTMVKLMEESNVPPERAFKIESAYTEEFEDELPAAEFLIDAKAVAAHEEKKRQTELIKKVEVLEQELKEHRQEKEEEEEKIKTYEVVLRVKDDKADNIRYDTVNGQRCLVIPMDENEHVILNGIHM